MEIHLTRNLSNTGARKVTKYEKFTLEIKKYLEA
jgi:hypothetical protein